MKLKTLLALVILSGSSAHAQTVQDDVAVLEKKRTAEVARATDTVNRTYLGEYEKLLQRANLVGDASGANLVRTMIRQLKPASELTPPDTRPAAAAIPTSTADPVAVLTGHRWIDESTSDKGHHHLFPREFLPDGHMTSTYPHQSGTWEIANNELAIKLSSYPDVTEKFRLPVQLDKWRSDDGHFLNVDRTGGNGGAALTPAPSASPAKASDFFGQHNP